MFHFDPWGKVIVVHHWKGTPTSRGGNLSLRGERAVLTTSGGLPESEVMSEEVVREGEVDSSSDSTLGVS